MKIKVLKGLLYKQKSILQTLKEITKCAYFSLIFTQVELFVNCENYFK